MIRPLWLVRVAATVHAVPVACHAEAVDEDCVCIALVRITLRARQRPGMEEVDWDCVGIWRLL